MKDEFVIPICEKHGKPITHVLGCEDCLKESSTGNPKVDEILHLKAATEKLYEKIGDDQQKLIGSEMLDD